MYRPDIIDIEASGFGAESFPIEIGVVKGSGDRYCTLINPPSAWKYWSDTAEEVHGIDRGMLAIQGKDIQVVCAELNNFVGEQILYSDAWSHDSFWLRRLYQEAGMVCSFTVRAIEHIVSENQLARWDDTKIKVQSSLGVVRHRASTDALIIQQTFVESWQTAV